MRCNIGRERPSRPYLFKMLNLFKKLLEIIKSCAIIIMHKKIAAVVQRLVPMLAMHMMAVRFRSVAPILILWI